MTTNKSTGNKPEEHPLFITEQQGIALLLQALKEADKKDIEAGK